MSNKAPLTAKADNVATQNDSTPRSLHTPGPWSHFARLSGSENHKGYYITTTPKFDVTNGMTLAEVRPLDPDGAEGGANARLIAAAPEYHSECYVLAMEVLQSDLYTQRPNVKRLVDGLLALREEVIGAPSVQDGNEKV